MLTDTQLEFMSDRMGIPLAKEGVVFKNELPKKLEYNKSYFINLENSVDENGQNQGTHWTCLQVNKYKDGKIQPFYFDPYGMPPPENIKKVVMENTGQKLPFNTKDIQSLMNNACGYYCSALLHYVNKWSGRTGDLYLDAEHFLDMFDDLNKSVDFKKNEYILKHFFQSSDPKLRKVIEIDDIVNGDSGGLDGMGMRIPADIKIMK